MMELDRLDVFRWIYDSFITSTISFSTTKESFIIKFTVRRYYIYLLWDALDRNHFYFLFLLFSDFIGILFFFFFSFLFFWMIKRHVTSQSHDVSHDVTS